MAHIERILCKGSDHRSPLLVMVALSPPALRRFSGHSTPREASRFTFRSPLPAPAALREELAAGERSPGRWLDVQPPACTRNSLKSAKS